MKKICRFLKTDVKIRSVENEPNKRVIEGLIPYNKKSVNMGWDDAPSYEVILPTAFNKTLGDKAKVVALFSHDRTKVLGNTRAGTLELESTDDGLVCRCTLGNTSWANDCWDMIQRGDCTQMSFGFWPYKVRTEGNVDYLESVKLDEVSFCVLDPAYEDTTSKAELRSLDEIKRAYNSLSDEEKEELKNTILIKETTSEEEETEENTMTEEELAKLKEELKAEILDAVLTSIAEKQAEEKEVEQPTAEEESKDIPPMTDSTTDDITEEKATEEENAQEETDDNDEEKDKILDEVEELLKEEE